MAKASDGGSKPRAKARAKGKVHIRKEERARVKAREAKLSSSRT